MYDSVIDLITRTKTLNAIGSVVEGPPVRRTVFAEVASVGCAEFYQAFAVGLRPEIKLILADYLEYGGEKQLEYGGEVYDILRTYRKNETLELVAQRAPT